MSGTLGVTGVVTSNAGVVVDNFTLDGTTLALSSGDMLIDVAGNIQLDADDNGETRFLDDGTGYLTLKKDGNNAVVQSQVSDGDLVLGGNDGGSLISALTLDMSDAGTATFNHDIKVTGDILNVGSTDFTIDVSQDLNLDSGHGDFYFKDGGSTFLNLYESSDDTYFLNPRSDGDIIFQGNDGGSTIVALTLDMSDIGTASFLGNVLLPDGRAFIMGAGGDFQIYHESNVNIINAATSDQDIQFRGNDGGSGITALTLDMSDAGSAYFNNKVGINTTSPTGYLNVNGNSAVNNIGFNLTWGGVGGGQSGVVYGMKLAAQSNNSGSDTYGVFSQAAQGVGGNSCGVYGDNNINGLTQNSGSRSIGVWGKCVDNSSANGGSPYLANAQIKAGVLGLVTQTNSSSNSQNAAVVANNQCTSAAICYGVAIHTTAGPNAVKGLEYDHNGTVVLNIASTGNVTNTNNSYGAISDLKLKENISSASSQWDDIKAVQVKNYSLKTDELDAANRIGVIAQDLEASGMGGLVEDDVMPIMDEDGIVDPTQTETTKQVKYSVLYMKAVKALQEAMTRIEALETKVTALENA